MSHYLTKNIFKKPRSYEKKKGTYLKKIKAGGNYRKC